MPFTEDAQMPLGANPQSKGFLTPVAYLWTRTVRCKNPGCGATVPLVKQTWLCKKDGRHAALKMVAPPGEKRVRFEVVEAKTAAGLGFDPEAFSKAGNATCPFCGTVVDSDYVKDEGCAARMGDQFMALVCSKPGEQGKVYLTDKDLPEPRLAENAVQKRIKALCRRNGLTVPNEPMPKQGTLAFRVQPYGFETWGHMFCPRQMLCLLTFAPAVREAEAQMKNRGHGQSNSAAVVALLAAIVDRLADLNPVLCVHNYFGSSRIAHPFGRHALPMVWDFAEANPFNEVSGGFGVEAIVAALASPDADVPLAAQVVRGSASALPWKDGNFDAVVTDPPCYDNVPYADISNFFYIWLKRMVGHLFPEHFATELTPKKDGLHVGASRELKTQSQGLTPPRAFRADRSERQGLAPFAKNRQPPQDDGEPGLTLPG